LVGIFVEAPKEEGEKAAPSGNDLSKIKKANAIPDRPTIPSFFQGGRKKGG